MKKLLVLFLGLLVFAGCKEDDHLTPDTPPKPVNTDLRFYGVKLPEGPAQLGAAQRDKLWYNGTIIKVRFLDRNSELEELIKTCAREWESYCNISFNFIEDGDAHVRIGFNRNEERYISWSYIGTDCKAVTDQNEPTMSFFELEWLDEEEQRGDILRMFGLVLGLELEHRNQNFVPNWVSEARAQGWWENELSDINWEVLKKYVYDPMDADYAIQTDYDPESIMVWPFPRNVLRNGITMKNHELSETDIAFIGQLYPQLEVMTVKVKIEIDYPADVFFVLNSDMDLDGLFGIKVDWGDGVVERIPFDPIHTYCNSGEYIIKIYANVNHIASIYWASGNVMEMDISELIQLKRFYIEGHDEFYDLSELDVSKNLLLEDLTVMKTKLTGLDLSNNLLLKTLYCGSNMLTELDISANTQLSVLDCSENEMTNLDLSNNLLLEELRCGSNPFIALDVSNNLSLKELYCTNSSLTDLSISTNTQLRILDCRDNHMANLNVDNNSFLGELRCDNNPLTTLNVSNNLLLGLLSCNNNQLTSLDLSVNPIRSLQCENNLLTELDLSNKPNLFWVSCGLNPFILDRTALENMAKSLPHRSSSGTLVINNDEAKSWIAAICSQKNWWIR